MLSNVSRISGITAPLIHQGDNAVRLLILGVAAVLVFLASGFGTQQGTDRQNLAEAAAIEGARELPSNPTGAVSRATDWATSRGIQLKSVQVRSSSEANDTLYVEISGNQQWMLGRLISHVVPASGPSAAASVSSRAESKNLMPWALLQGDSTCLDSDGKAILTAVCTVKVGAGGLIKGWYGALDYDGKGGGAAEYEANIIDGTTERKYCVANDPAPDCASAFSEIDALDGNQVGQTDRGVDQRTAVAPCDTNGNGKDDFDEVFATYPGTNPPYKVLCPNSPRLIRVPIVSYDSTPVKTVTIRGWILGYLNAYACVPEPIAVEAASAGVAQFRNESSAAASTPPRAQTLPATPTPTPTSTPGADEHGSRASRRQPEQTPTPTRSPTHTHGEAHTRGPKPDPTLTPTPTPSPKHTPPSAPQHPRPTPAPASAPPVTPPATDPTRSNAQFAHAYISVHASPVPPPAEECHGKGHWQVFVNIVDAAYSQNSGFLAATSPAAKAKVTRLVK